MCHISLETKVYKFQNSGCEISKVFFPRKRSMEIYCSLKTYEALQRWNIITKIRILRKFSIMSFGWRDLWTGNVLRRWGRPRPSWKHRRRKRSSRFKRWAIVINSWIEGGNSCTAFKKMSVRLKTVVGNVTKILEPSAWYLNKRQRFKRWAKWQFLNIRTAFKRSSKSMGWQC